MLHTILALFSLTSICCAAEQYEVLDRPLFHMPSIPSTTDSTENENTAPRLSEDLITVELAGEKTLSYSEISYKTLSDCCATIIRKLEPSSTLILFMHDTLLADPTDTIVSINLLERFDITFNITGSKIQNTLKELEVKSFPEDLKSYSQLNEITVPLEHIHGQKLKMYASGRTVFAKLNQNSEQANSEYDAYIYAPFNQTMPCQFSTLFIVHQMRNADKFVNTQLELAKTAPMFAGKTIHFTKIDATAPEISPGLSRKSQKQKESSTHQTQTDYAHEDDIFYLEM